MIRLLISKEESNMLCKLKILFVSSAYPPESDDSIWTYTIIMASALASRGHEVHILSCVRGQKHKDYLDQGVFIHLRGQVRIRFLDRINRILQVPRTITRLHIGLSTFFEYRRLDIDFDIIEYPDWEAEGLIFALLRTRPLVAELHTPLPLIHKYSYLPMNRDIFLASALEHFAVRHADAIISPSRLLIQALKDIGWLPDLSPSIIPHAIDWWHWCDNICSVLDTPPTVLFLGNLTRLKAPELLTEAISIVRREIPEAKALFAGGNSGRRDGLPYLEWIKKSTSDLDGCQFVGHVRRRELTHLLSISRVLVIPSWFENYSLVALEAMAAGRPIIVTSMSGITELIKQTGVGWVVPPGDPKTLAKVLLSLLGDPAYAAREGEKARATVQEWSDPDKIAAQRELVYQQTITSSKHKM